MVSTLANVGENRKAFDLICAIFEIVDVKIPDEIMAIEPHNEVVAFFVQKFWEDLVSIPEEDKYLVGCEPHA